MSDPQTILERTAKYNNVSVLPNIIENCSNQREIVEKLSEYSPDASSRSVDEFTNAGLLCEEAFDDREVLETSIFLALRARKDMEVLILNCGEVSIRSRPAVIPGSFNSTSRLDIAKFLAKEIVNDPRAVGFSLAFKYNRNQRQPSGYEVSIYQTADPEITRADMKEAGISQIDTEISVLVEGLEKDDNGNYNVGYSELEAKKEAIRNKVTIWSPKYIAQFTT